MEKLIKGLRKFQSSYFSTHKELFEQLSLGQKPRVLFITCSDSRIDPNLITNSEVGELFIIRNAGNIIPPYGAANGGEGAAIEYAVHALGIEEIIVCGHSHCGAMKGLLKRESLKEKMPLVYEWLEHAEATRRLVNENYVHFEGEALLDITIAENVLTQIENLRTYPVIHSKLRQGHISLTAWVYHIETGAIYAYDALRHEYVSPSSPLEPLEPEALLGNKEENLSFNSRLNSDYAYTSTNNNQLQEESSNRILQSSSGWLSSEQSARIYRGSAK